MNEVCKTFDEKLVSSVCFIKHLCCTVLNKTSEYSVHALLLLLFVAGKGRESESVYSCEGKSFT
jgi:hypothetical protein